MPAHLSHDISGLRLACMGSTNFIGHISCLRLAKSIRPEVRGTTDFYDGAYPPSKTSPSYGWAETDS